MRFSALSSNLINPTTRQVQVSDSISSGGGGGGVSFSMLLKRLASTNQRKYFDQSNEQLVRGEEGEQQDSKARIRDR